MMITKLILAVFLSLDTVSTYIIRHSEWKKCRWPTVANTRRMPCHPPPFIHRRVRILLAPRTETKASSSETSTDQGVPINVDVAARSSDASTSDEGVCPTPKMRVSELKKALAEWNINYDDCFDQESLIVRYNEALQKQQFHKQEQDDGTTATTATATAVPTPSQNSTMDTSNSEPQQTDEEMIQSIRQMSIKELREELGQRRISRVGLLEKTDLIHAVYEARLAVQTFSVTGLLQPSLVNEVTGDELQLEIQNKNDSVTTPLLVDVYATWCGPCQLMSKQLIDVAETFGNTLRIVKLDSDKYTDISSQLRIQGLPTIILYSSKGTELNRVEGALMKDQLIQWIQEQQK